MDATNPVRVERTTTLELTWYKSGFIEIDFISVFLFYAYKILCFSSLKAKSGVNY